MEIINLEKENEIYNIKDSVDFRIIPSTLSDISLRKNIDFKFEKSNVKSKIVFKSVLHNNVNLDIKIRLFSESKEIVEVEAFLEIHILNLSSKNNISVTPVLEIPQKNIKFEHKVTIGTPSKEWMKYIFSRGIGKKEGIELIAKSFEFIN